MMSKMDVGGSDTKFDPGVSEKHHILPCYIHHLTFAPCISHINFLPRSIHCCFLFLCRTKQIVTMNHSLSWNHEQLILSILTAMHNEWNKSFLCCLDRKFLPMWSLFRHAIFSQWLFTSFFEPCCVSILPFSVQWQKCSAAVFFGSLCPWFLWYIIKVATHFQLNSFQIVKWCTWKIVHNSTTTFTNCTIASKLPWSLHDCITALNSLWGNDFLQTLHFKRSWNVVNLRMSISSAILLDEFRG